jgi:hypothetical protein
MPSIVKHIKKEKKPYPTNSLFSDFQLFLLRKLLSPNIAPSQLNIQHPLHRTQHFLVRRRRTPLHILHHGNGRITFRGELLLSHFVAFVVAAPFDGVADLGADGFWFDDVVAAVDFCEVLAFGGACAAGL